MPPLLIMPVRPWEPEWGGVCVGGTEGGIGDRIRGGLGIREQRQRELGEGNQFSLTWPQSTTEDNSLTLRAGKQPTGKHSPRPASVALTWRGASWATVLT